MPNDDMPQPNATQEACHSRLDRAIDRCRTNNWRLTPIRRRTMELMCRTSGSLKAYQLIDHVGDDRSTSSPMRVYRALDFLTKHGFVRHLKTINAFTWCEFPEATPETPFLICDDCGSVEALFDEKVRNFLHERSALVGFKVDLKTMELHGMCRQCVDRPDSRGCQGPDWDTG